MCDLWRYIEWELVLCLIKCLTEYWFLGQVSFGFRGNEVGVFRTHKVCRVACDFLMVMLRQIVKCEFELCSSCCASVLGMLVSQWHPRCGEDLGHQGIRCLISMCFSSKWHSFIYLILVNYVLCRFLTMGDSSIVYLWRMVLIWWRCG